MPYISVDIDMGDLEISDMCKELAARVERSGIGSMSLREQQYVKDLAKTLGTSVIGEIPNRTLEDRMKIEWISANWDKFNSWDLDKIL